MKKIQDANINNKKVLVRIDTDILNDDGQIQNDSRLKASLPTIKYLLSHQATVTLCGHIDRPKGKVIEKLRMKPVEGRLVKLIGNHNNWKVLENLRFDPGEEENSSEFAKKLAEGQEIFIEDAFATCHRAHASTEGVAKILPSYAGLSVQKEIENLEKLIDSKEKPFTVILGGAKIADKLPVIKNLMSKADNFLIGGAIANTFLAARRHHMGKSRMETEAFREANIIWQNLMDETQRNLYLPEDLVLSLSAKAAEDVQEINVEQLLEPDFAFRHADYFAVDIGPQTVKTFQRVLKDSKKIFWNGNMGVSEVKEFANGTENIAQALSESDAQIVIGGGDTVAAFESLNLKPKPNIFLSTGGGATLEFLAGKQLPGLKVLDYY